MIYAATPWSWVDYIERMREKAEPEDAALIRAMESKGATHVLRTRRPWPWDVILADGDKVWWGRCPGCASPVPNGTMPKVAHSCGDHTAEWAAHN